MFDYESCSLQTRERTLGLGMDVLKINIQTFRYRLRGCIGYLQTSRAHSLHFTFPNHYDCAFLSVFFS